MKDFLTSVCEIANWVFLKSAFRVAAWVCAGFLFLIIAIILVYA